MALKTENDIVDYLRKQVVSFKKEIARLENGLQYFTGQNTSKLKRSKPAKEVSPAKEENLAKSNIRGRKPRTSWPVPESYDAKLTWDDKILYIVKELGSGYIADVIQKITEHEPEIDTAKAERLVRQRMSAMAGKKILKVKGKAGNKREYTI